MRVFETIYGRGHPNISATHPTTLAVTRDSRVSRRGDCFVATSANKSLADFSLAFKSLASNPKAKITVEIKVEDLSERIMGVGDPRLIFSDPEELVIRKSRYACPRTLMLGADKAAADLPRGMVELMADYRVAVMLKATIEL